MVLSGLVGYQVWHLITGCHLFVGLTPTIAKAVNLPSMTFAVEQDVKPEL